MLSRYKRIQLCKINSKIPSLIMSEKRRASLSSSFFLKGGMALEGCLVLPLFLFFMSTLLYGMEVVRFQNNAFSSMHRAISKSCFLAYEEYGRSGVRGDSNNFGAKSRKSGGPEGDPCQIVRESLDQEPFPYLCVKGGEAGVAVLAKTDAYENISVKINYDIRPFIYLLPIGTLKIEDGMFGHGFTGYVPGNCGKTEGETEIYVYITENGTRYHLSDQCTYLRVKIQALSSEETENMRNGSGEKYTACERCRPVKGGLVYLTTWGNRYHGESDCSALQRTVYMVPLSEVGDRSACSKCG